MNRDAVKLAPCLALVCSLGLSIVALGAGILTGRFGGNVFYAIPRVWLIVALCIVLAIIAILVGFAAIAQRCSTSTSHSTHCTGCGRDLAASKDRYPECGRVIESMETDSKDKETG